MTRVLFALFQPTPYYVGDTVEVERAITIDGIRYCHLGFKGDGYRYGKVVSDCDFPVGTTYSNGFMVERLLRVNGESYREFCIHVQYCSQYWP